MQQIPQKHLQLVKIRMSADDAVYEYILKNRALVGLILVGRDNHQLYLCLQRLAIAYEQIFIYAALALRALHHFQEHLQSSFIEVSLVAANKWNHENLQNITNELPNKHRESQIPALLVENLGAAPQNIFDMVAIGVFSRAWLNSSEESEVGRLDQFDFVDIEGEILEIVQEMKDECKILFIELYLPQYVAILMILHAQHQTLYPLQQQLAQFYLHPQDEIQHFYTLKSNCPLIDIQPLEHLIHLLQHLIQSLYKHFLLQVPQPFEMFLQSPQQVSD